MRIELSRSAEKELHKLDTTIAKRILEYLHSLSLLENPRSEGKSLSGNLSGYWRYRVGNYRVICDGKMVIMVLKT
jgi:mRNA interferase RelE/StbE